MEHKQNAFKIISNKKQSVQIFSNPLLERLSRADPLDLFYFYMPAILYLCHIGIANDGLGLAIIEFVTGLAFWTILEYIIHRFIFHYKASSRLGKKIFFLHHLHKVHHAYPRDPKRLVAPPILTSPFLILTGFFYYLIFGKHFIVLFSGTLAGYILYEILHYVAHRFKFTNPILRYLKKYHLHHHYIENDRCFSVSIPLLDCIFGTQPLKPFKRLQKNTIL